MSIKASLDEQLPTASDIYQIGDGTPVSNPSATSGCIMRELGKSIFSRHWLLAKICSAAIRIAGVAGTSHCPKATKVYAGLHCRDCKVTFSGYPKRGHSKYPMQNRGPKEQGKFVELRNIVTT
jgi:hypothetical protein